MDEIREWLKGPKRYDDGATIYLKFGKDPKLKQVFREPESPFKKKLLESTLKAMLQKRVVQEVKQQEKKKVAISNVGWPEKKWPEERDNTLQALYETWKPKFAEMMSLMSRLYDVALAGQTDEAKKQEAGQMAHKILDLDDECDAIYEKRDHYLQHKSLPAEQPLMELVVDPLKIPLALQNEQRYVRDYKNKLKKELGNLKAAEQLRKHEWAVDQYKKILKID